MFAALYAPSVPPAAIVEVARAFTPRFEHVGPVIMLDASGLSRLFGSAQELGEHLRDALSKLAPGDSLPRVAIASTQAAAALLALGSPGLTVVMPGKEAIALAPLGVGVLDHFERVADSARSAPSAQPQAASPARPSHVGKHPRVTHEASRPRPRAPASRLLEIFTKWGIRTLGALSELPGPEIHERCGERGALWQSLARGVDARPMVPWVDDIPFEAALELEWPIEGLEPLSFVLARLLEPLADRLERADRGAAVLYTSLRLTSRTVLTRALQLPAPMRDPKTLRTLILLDLESHPPDAPIDIVRIYIEPTPAKVLQWTLLERAQPAVEQVSTLVARLTALMGEGHVGSPVLVDTWKPGAFEISDFRSQISDFRSQISDVRSQISDLSTIQPINQQSEISHLRSALRRFRFPIPTRVTVSEGRPVRVQTDRQGFTSGAIVQAAGPWRTSGNWWSASAREQSSELRRDHHAVAASGREGGWDTPGPRMKAGQQANGPTGQQDAWDRDEWDVAMNDGTIYRLVVERAVGQWFVEGVID
jgi:protein ImuB